MKKRLPERTPEKDYYAHFVAWRKKAWPKASLPDDLPWIVSNYVSHFPGRSAPLALQLIKEREYGTEETRGRLPDGEGDLRHSPSGKPTGA